MTHNFAEDIVITSNNDTILKKTITKKISLVNCPLLKKNARLEQHKKLDLVAEEIDVATFKVKCEGNLTVK
jgi:hypothetical protein